MGRASSDRCGRRLSLQVTLKTCRLSIAKNLADFRLLARIATWLDVHQEPMGRVNCCTLQAQDNVHILKTCGRCRWLIVSTVNSGM